MRLGYLPSEIRPRLWLWLHGDLGPKLIPETTGELKAAALQALVLSN